jgi:LacI family repressor for deo operon, udp, cdd, tsx, nupC, and nupG
MSNHTGIKQIAEIVGVSVTTVSRALNDPKKLKPETRRKVLQAFEDYGYVYNAAAADLVRQKSTVIGVLIPNATTPLFASTLLGIQDYLQEVGYSMLVGSSKYDDTIENRLLQQFHERQVSGIIRVGFGYNRARFEDWLKSAEIPCVIMLEKLHDSEMNYVGFDNHKAALAMTNYLTSLNHKRIGLLIGPYSRTERVKKRLEGYRAGLKAAGLEVDPEIIIETEISLSNGANAFNELYSRENPPTAIFAAADYLALGALRAAHEKGLVVPQDISIAGFGDIDVAAYSNPPLTTVRVPGYQCAYLATEVLLKLINKERNRKYHYCLDTDLIIRSSCEAI